MEEILKVVIGAVVLWVVSLEVRLKLTQSKLSTHEQKENHEKIAKNTGVLSDAELNSLLDKDLGSGH